MCINGDLNHDCQLHGHIHTYLANITPIEHKCFYVLYLILKLNTYIFIKVGKNKIGSCQSQHATPRPRHNIGSCQASIGSMDNRSSHAKSCWTTRGRPYRHHSHKPLETFSFLFQWQQDGEGRRNEQQWLGFDDV